MIIITDKNHFKQCDLKIAEIDIYKKKKSNNNIHMLQNLIGL